MPNLFSFRFFLGLSLLAAGSLGAAPKGAPDWKLGSNEGTFLMISDLHFDPFADPKLVPDLIRHPVEDWEALLQSSGEKAPAAEGKDSNWPLLISALEEAQSRGPYDYALFTGDYLVHESRKLFEPFGGPEERAYEDFVLKTEIFVAREVQKNLPGIPVYFCLGNNDSECGDYMLAGHSDFLDRLSREWAVFAGHPEAAQSFRDTGDYVLPHPTVPGMELVVLNDVYWSSRFSPDSCHPEGGDPGRDAMERLKKYLRDAKSKNLKVQLVMHIPPAGDVYSTYVKMNPGQSLAQAAQLFWAPDYENQFLGLLRAYPEILVSGFAGHTHMDDFRVLADTGGKGAFFIHICPAVSPIRGNQPGFQVARYDRGTGAIRDLATYDLTMGKSPAWRLAYDFDRDYGLDGYDGPALIDLTDKMQKNEALLRKFAFHYRGAMPHPPKGKFIPDDAWKILNGLHTFWTAGEPPVGSVNK